ncbi:MAG: CHAT domain-containing protein, partial [Rhodocyclaceae bacterium]|nr:CHAT domain-containing protein [Rhodocyclaceae bacterium]
RWAEALEVFNQRDRGLRSNPVQFARTGSNNINWAMALLRNGQVDEAERMLRSMVAWNLKKPFADPLYLAHLRGYHALALVAGGKDDAALAQFREAFPVMLRQAETDNSSDNGGFVRQYRLRLIAEGYLDLLARRAVRNAAAPDQELIAEAFRVAEAARGSSVQTAIANSLARASLPDATLADLARREQDAANQISSLNALLVRLASSPESQRLDKAIAEIRGEVARIEARHAELRRELAQRYPAYAELIAPKAPSPAEVQKALQPNEVAVALLVTERRTYVWTVTPTRIAFRIAELSREQADKQVSALLAAFDLSGGKLPHYDAGAARELYRILLAPDEKLWEGASVLNVIVNGRLGQLPFAVLLTGDPDKPSLAEQPWLIGKIALVQQPSAGTLVSLRAQVRKQAERRPFVGFGDPTFVAREARKPAGTRSIRNLSVAKGAEDAAELPAPSRQAAGAPTDGGRTILLRGFDRLPQLPETADELIEIGRILGADPKSDLFLGARATEAKVKGSDLSHYGVVAFATHGLVPGELQGLDQPSLAMANPVLSGDKDNDGFLTMSEVLGLKLDADWVVLSACNTASGDGRNEEAISGLGRAFFFAGTRRLLLTYWPVETVSASLLTTELFKRQKAQPGESKAEALRHSMLRLMASSNEYGHPAFWAPYGLVGDAMK